MLVRAIRFASSRGALVSAGGQQQQYRALQLAFNNSSNARSIHLIASTGGRGLNVAYSQHALQQPLRRTMFIQTAETPNPDSLKFVPNRTVVPEELGTGYDFRRGAKDLHTSPLGRVLFRIDGVEGVYLGRDFVSVTKSSNDVNGGNPWQVLKPDIFAAIMDFYAEFDEAVVLADDAVVNSDTRIEDDDDEVVAMIKELLETRIRPAVQDDGGDILYRGFDPETGVVSVQLAGSCAGCPSSSVTLHSGVENMLMHYIPEVSGVMQIEDEASEEDDPRKGLLGGREKVYRSLEEKLAAAGIPNA